MSFTTRRLALLAFLLTTSCATAPSRINESGRATDAPKVAPAKSIVVDLNDASGRLSFPRVLRHAQEENPSIRAARSTWEAMLHKRAQNTEYPDPTFKFGYFAEEVRTRTGDQVLSIGVSQKVPWPGKLASQGRIADLMAMRAEAMAYAVTRNVLVEVSSVFVEYDFLTRAISTADTITAAWKRVLVAAQKDPGAQRVAELIRAETELAQSQFDLTTWQDLRKVEAAKLRALLDLPSSSMLGAPALTLSPDALPSLVAIQQAARQHNQDLAVAEVTVRISRERITLAEQKDRPAFSVGGRYIATRQRDDADPRFNGNDPLALELGISIPLGRKAKRAAVLEADHLASAATNKLHATQNKLDADLAGWYWKAVNAQRQVRLYHDSLLPQARQAAAAAETFAQTQSRGLAGTLETVANWHHLELAALRAQADFRLATLQLEKHAGTPLSFVNDSPGSTGGNTP